MTHAAPSRPGLPTTLRHVQLRLTDLMFPPVCLACRTPVADADTLCAACWASVDFIRPPLCDRLGLPLGLDTGGAMVSAAALAEPPVHDRGRAVAVFGDTMKRLIHGLKYNDRHDGRRLFGRWLADAGADLLADADVIVPVPLHPWRLWSRKFNQSAILAKEVARLTGVPNAPTALIRWKRTVSQVDLTREERKRNVADAFAVSRWHRHRIEGRRVVLIDDVVTTGATCGAATRALRTAKAARVDVLALAIVSHTTT
jgi:ComF family protein